MYRLGKQVSVVPGYEIFRERASGIGKRSAGRRLEEIMISAVTVDEVFFGLSRREILKNSPGSCIPSIFPKKLRLRG